ncbi:MAG: hypothetical protein HOW73_33600 [Polyangiaceae bacterium]|nr:hypothetical protein [Polyangiaceae bacterium]
MKLAKRTRRRGALDKAVTFAWERAARIAASPPLASPFGAPRRLPAPSGASAFRLLTRAVPWTDPAPASPTPLGPNDVLVVTAEGRFFGGSYELCEQVRTRCAFMVVSDVFVSPAQIQRARRAGADAIAPIVRALAHPSEDLAELARAARELGLDVIPEVATPAEVTLARDLASERVFVSLRDRDTHRPAIDEVAAVLASAHEATGAANIEVLALFADDLPKEHAEKAANLAFERCAIHVAETLLLGSS